MRCFKLAFTVATVVACMLPSALANKASPASGATFTLFPEQWASVNIKGFKKCDFSVTVMDFDPKVVSVSFNKEDAKKHRVDITAIAPGMTQVTIETVGKDPNCNGFFFTYMVEVEADTKAFVKQAKGKLKDASKVAKDAGKDLVQTFCDDLSIVADGFLAGELTVDEALDEAFNDAQDLIDLMDFTLDPFLDATFADIWTRAVLGGLNQINDDVVGFLPGACGEWDQFEDGVRKEIDKAIKTLDKKLKKFEKTIDKALKGDDLDLLMVWAFPEILLAVDDPVALPADPPTETPAPATPKNLEKSWNASGRLDDSAVGRLHTGGQADPGGGMVTITINGPDGATATVMSAVDGNCAWRAEFPGIKPGDYSVTATQGTNKITYKWTVP